MHALLQKINSVIQANLLCYLNNFLRVVMSQLFGFGYKNLFFAIEMVKIHAQDNVGYLA